MSRPRFDRMLRALARSGDADEKRIATFIEAKLGEPDADLRRSLYFCGATGRALLGALEMDARGGDPLPYVVTES